MPFDTPFRLGPFLVDEAGGLMPPPDRDARFTLRWRGCRVNAALRPTGANPTAPDSIALRLQAILGRVPSSAEAGAPQRGALLAALHEITHHLQPGLSCGLSADHRVILHGETPMALPLTSRTLVTQVTRFLLDVAPYLDLTVESGATPVGTVNT